MMTDVKCPKHDKFMQAVCGDLVCPACYDQALVDFPPPPPPKHNFVQVWNKAKGHYDFVKTA